MSDVITSTANGRVKAVRGLHQGKARRLRRETIIEGPTVLDEFLGAGIVPTVVLCTPDDHRTIDAAHRYGFEPTLVSDEVLASASDTRTPRGPVCVVGIPRPRALRRHNTLVLVDIADPGNVGTMIRSAAALGWDIAVAGATADIWSPKTVRSSAGTHVHTRIAALDDPLADAISAGLEPVATVVSGGEAPLPPTEPVALLVGSEAHGLSPSIIDACATAITIPMPGGTESLNAAVAASVAMFAMNGSREEPMR